MTRKKIAVSLVILVVISAAAAALVLRLHRWTPRLTTIQGAVVRRDQDPEKQVPVAGALIAASRGDVSASTRSDASGYFKITFPEVIWPGQTVLLSFRHQDYHPLDMPLTMEFRSTSRRLIVAFLKPIAPPAVTPAGKSVVVSNLLIRYTVNSETEVNVGSAVKTFQVVNQANVPCRHQGPCSPDGNWKASTASVTLDAGLGNKFEDARASCIAGPCPFTKIDSNGFAHGGQTIVASATDWSDTATFLLEAQVFHTTLDSGVRESYPVIFDQTLNFTLPATQEGVSLEADVNGAAMVFPLGPDIYLDWATCTSRTNPGTNSIVYQCDLKPGYRF